ncbi:MAG: DUF1214 domain-containing protein [Pseudomonadota bacterium]
MRLLANIIIVFVIGLMLGGVSAHYSIRQSHGVGAINVGPWSAWPFVGGVEIDPYTLARGTANGTLPLGAAEGLAFEAIEDSAGRPLNRTCSYTVSGATPPSRLWTLTAYAQNGKVLSAANNQLASKHSGNIIRFADGTFTIGLGDMPSSGNWMPLSGNGSFKIILRLYDTPITSNSGVIDPEMPQIKRKQC